MFMFTPHVQRERRYVIGAGVLFIYMTPKSLNDTLAVDLPFQTLAVNFSSKL